MTTEWEPVQRAKTYELVLDKIEEQILTGRLRVGDRLPPERQLAAALGVSRPALREALRILEAQGALVAQVGRGPDAGATIAAQPADALGRLLRLHLALSHYDLGEVVDARVMFERASVTAAAVGGSPERLQRAEKILDEMETPGLPREEFNDLDTRYHVELALASGNQLVGTMTAALRESVRHLILHAFAQLTDWEGTAGMLRAQHRAILRAVRSGRPEEAAVAVEAHIRGFLGKLAEQRTAITER
ncbi:FadR/GntR family transcriptional regulator [Gandjariella thermophila]|uniref:GntR family transcriptional regulator n=1 Tax=Gandjariella thermophila TaxID=1931992 RepID=A0A4D4J8E5_9PSEU|nr:GntR family transcriptional regulator [Gandjariella thermophila]GDY32931.1 GntR family transcriptional regulator [Gandjariella thermophila]